MKHPTIRRVAIIVISVIVGISICIVAAIYLWPLTKASLQTGVAESIGYAESIDRVAKINQDESSQKVSSDCSSKVLTHGEKAAKAVVMLHGVTACPKQYEGLSKVFYDAGYNVYIPRTPYHGLPDPRQHGKVTAQDLVDYANDSVTIATGLGQEVGVVGLSGGGAVATWAAEYRPEVARAVVLSPFYEPDAAKAPKWQLPALNSLYGLHILPDTFIEPASPTDAAFSYSALANYNIVTKNLKKSPTNLSLKSIGLVTSASDDQIDLQLAQSIPELIASSNNLTLLQTVIPKEWNAGHDIVSLSNKVVNEQQDRLFQLYLSYYEGRQASL